MNNVEFDSGTERVYARLEGQALHIRFNNPARYNALSVDMWAAIPKLLEQAEEDERVRVVLFSGTGGKAFVSGADISQFEDMRAAKEAVAKYEVLAESALMGIYNFSKPTIAAINGYCIGGGVNVAISCDIRIAAEDAVFCIPAAKLGLGYRYSAMKNLIDLVGPGPAKDLFFTARRVGAAEALSIGLITKSCPTDELSTVLVEYATSIANNAPLTIGAAKAITREILKTSSTADLKRCSALIKGCFESADYTEGRTAFMEKRAPVFQGR